MHMKVTCIKINTYNFSERQHARHKPHKSLKLPQEPKSNLAHPDANASLMQMTLSGGVRNVNTECIFPGDQIMFTDYVTETVFFCPYFHVL